MRRYKHLVFLLLIVLSFSIVNAQPIIYSEKSRIDTIQEGSTVQVPINIKDASNLYAFSLDLSYDNPSIISYSSISEGPFLSQGGVTLLNGANQGMTVVSSGLIEDILFSRQSNILGVSGNGLLATVNFNNLASGVTDLTFSNVQLSDPDGNAITNFDVYYLTIWDDTNTQQKLIGETVNFFATLEDAVRNPLQKTCNINVDGSVSPMSFQSGVYSHSTTFSSAGQFTYTVTCDNFYTVQDSYLIGQLTCTDVDGDGFGANCALGPDCNDNNPNVNSLRSCNYDGSTCGTFSLCLTSCPPTPKEICNNGVDDNCNGIVDIDCNSPPVLQPIGDKQIGEGQTLSFSVIATDANGDQLTYSASNLPSGATFNTITRTFTWTPSSVSAGNYPNVLFIVSDGIGLDSESITITVGDVNRLPVLSLIGDKQVSEGAILTFTISANDPNNDPLTYSASNLPVGASFDPSTKTFTWTPGFGTAGNYPNILFTVSDGTDQDSESITITVGDVNRLPVLQPVGNKQVDEGAILTFTISANDPDNDPLIYSASNLPTGASFNALTRTFTWTPSFGEAGNYQNIIFTVSDGTDQDSESITITVGDINRPPVLSQIGNRQISEGTSLTFIIVATDPDNDPLTYSASNLPVGASFNPSTKTFTWTPGFGSSGNYPNILFTVSDGTDQGLESITIIVGDVNRPPVMQPVGNKQVDEGETLLFIFSANDPDNDPLTYSASNLPVGASFNPSTKTFTWTPSFGSSGNYPNILFTVSDGTGQDSESITITVGDVNRLPVLSQIGDRQISEGTKLTFIIVATDPDNDPLTYSSSNLPSGASFNPSTKTLTWTPGFGSSGNYPNILFTVSDGIDQDSESITITVGDVNRPPVLTPIGNKNILEGETLDFMVSATDADNDMLTYTISNDPFGSSFNANTRTFRWTPLFGDSGVYKDLMFVVDDGNNQDSEFVTITVGNVNRPPDLQSIGNKVVAEGQTLSFSIIATDPDGNTLTYSASNLPLGSTFNPLTKTFTWTPVFGTSGNYPIVLFSVSDGTNQDSEQITITVGNVNRPPVLQQVGNKQVYEGDSLLFTLSANDPDNDQLTYSVNTIPSGASFDPIIKTFTWNPSIGSAGSYSVQFIVTDNGQPTESDSQITTITVLSKSTNCRDKTLQNQCSISKPMFCTANGDLVEQCGTCSCPSGLQCNSDGTCMQTGGGTIVPPVTICEEKWVCDPWSTCIGNFKTRQCQDINNCGTRYEKPESQISCQDNCFDGIQNNNEVGIDCGGACSKVCDINIKSQQTELIDSEKFIIRTEPKDLRKGKVVIIFDNNEGNKKPGVLFNIKLKDSNGNIISEEYFGHFTINEESLFEESFNMPFYLLEKGKNYKISATVTEKGRITHTFEDSFVIDTKPIGRLILRFFLVFLFIGLLVAGSIYIFSWYVKEKI